LIQAYLELHPKQAAGHEESYRGEYLDFARTKGGIPAAEVPEDDRLPWAWDKGFIRIDDFEDEASRPRKFRNTWAVLSALKEKKYKYVKLACRGYGAARDTKAEGDVIFGLFPYHTAEALKSGRYGPRAQKKKGFVCPWCPKMISNSDSTAAHILRNHYHACLVCAHCLRVFQEPANLPNHWMEKPTRKVVRSCTQPDRPTKADVKASIGALTNKAPAKKAKAGAKKKTEASKKKTPEKKSVTPKKVGSPQERILQRRLATKKKKSTKEDDGASVSGSSVSHGTSGSRKDQKKKKKKTPDAEESKKE
jgi:hypothetical protein